ncbi:DUF3619 family protein [Aliikangiella marina]|uniref:DUF3619 family protein n=1 Tax=Aliikangiella marina TaxID=1712262 RepID=A0A545TDD6_9GAMM|nr:DUF3619 family protein [Aliikangiella marina]TQV75201.1 DUF3619 family protein [Aliikangiella marina]
MNDDSKVETQINQALDDSVENLSPDVRRRLNQIRMRATEQKTSGFPIWKTAGAVSFAVVMGLVFQLAPNQQEAQNETFAQILEDDLLQEDLEMLEELEFIYWMAEESDSAVL